jgi:hypothetical protein
MRFEKELWQVFYLFVKVIFQGLSPLSFHAIPGPFTSNGQGNITEIIPQG